MTGEAGSLPDRQAGTRTEVRVEDHLFNELS